MAISPNSAFHRVFSSKDFLRGSARSAIFWSILSALLLGLLLFQLYLLSDLLISQGRLELPGNRKEALETLVGSELPTSRIIENASSNEGGDGETGTTIQVENGGILPAVWWSRNRYWGNALAILYQRVPQLRENFSALLVLILATAVLGLLRSWNLSRVKKSGLAVAENEAARLRRMLHRQTLRLGLSDLDGKSSRQAFELFTTKTDQVRNGLARWIERMARHPLELLVLLVLAFSIHWRLTLLCLIPLGACWYWMQRNQQRIDAERKRNVSKIEAELRLLAESLGKARLVRGYGMETFEHEQFQKHLHRFQHDTFQTAGRTGVRFWLNRFLLVAALSLVVYLIGTRVLMASESLSLAAGFSLLVSVGYLLHPFEELRKTYQDRKDVNQAADSIFRYLNQIPEVGQAVGAKFLNPLSKALRFESVVYPLSGNRRPLNGFDIRIPAGGMTALVSLDPLEAQAAAYMLPRFIEPQEGRVLFDDEDIAWVTLESLRAETVYVGGADPFFTGTVFENISCGQSSYSLQDVTEAAKQTRAHNFIQRLPQGYETVLGEHGEQLDPGQGYRLGLARAVLRNPAVMILEEPQARLDDGTKSLLDDAYNRIFRDRTVLLLPARLSTLRRADRIVLIHQGKVEAIGTQAELVKKSQLYRHWEYMQFNQFRQHLEPVG